MGYKIDDFKFAYCYLKAIIARMEGMETDNNSYGEVARSVLPKLNEAMKDVAVPLADEYFTTTTPDRE